MKRKIVVGALVGALVAALAIGALADPVDDTSMTSPDIGTNEMLTFVVAGEYPTRSDAEASTGSFWFGDLQGFYVVPSSAIEGLLPGKWLLASAFRTEGGATEFEELATAAGASSLRRITARYLGTEFVGLGQEPAPDGEGPLVADGPNLNTR